jgi:hypothetical protein
LTVSPKIAAIVRSINNKLTFIEPIAAKVLAAKSSESPGRKGIKTNPVSAKITPNKITKVSTPYCKIILCKCVSRCKKNQLDVVQTLKYSWFLFMIQYYFDY